MNADAEKAIGVRFSPNKERNAITTRSAAPESRRHLPMMAAMAMMMAIFAQPPPRAEVTREMKLDSDLAFAATCFGDKLGIERREIRAVAYLKSFGWLELRLINGFRARKP